MASKVFRAFLVWAMLSVCLLVPATVRAQEEQMPYLIRVNVATQVTTVFTCDENGEYTVPVRSMVCSTGREGHETPLGSYTIYGKHRWRMLMGNTYGQYISRFNGSYVFHSEPYFEQSPDTLIVGCYNRLGRADSHGCVRLRVIDAKWVYENCGFGTVVEILEDGDWEGVPRSVPVDRITNGFSWDPTDTARGNPHWRPMREPDGIAAYLK